MFYAGKKRLRRSTIFPGTRFRAQTVMPVTGNGTVLRQNSSKFIVIKHTERQAAIIPAVGAVQAMNVFPGNTALWPWLAQITPLFEHYHIAFCRLSWVPACPSTTPGTFIANFLYDASQPIEPTVNNLLCSDNCVSAPAWNNVSLAFNPRRLPHFWYSTWPSPVSQDLRHEFEAKFQYTFTDQGNPPPAGQIVAEYTVLFEHPRLHLVARGVGGVSTVDYPDDSGDTPKTLIDTRLFYPIIYSTPQAVSLFSDLPDPAPVTPPKGTETFPKISPDIFEVNRGDTSTFLLKKPGHYKFQLATFYSHLLAAAYVPLLRLFLDLKSRGYSPFVTPKRFNWSSNLGGYGVVPGSALLLDGHKSPNDPLGLSDGALTYPTFTYQGKMMMSVVLDVSQEDLDLSGGVLLVQPVVQVSSDNGVNWSETWSGGTVKWTNFRTWYAPDESVTDFPAFFSEDCASLFDDDDEPI